MKVHFAMAEKFLFVSAWKFLIPLVNLPGILGVFLPVPSNNALTEVRLWEEQLWCARHVRPAVLLDVFFAHDGLMVQSQ